MRKYHRMLCVFLILAFLLFPADRLPQAFAAETDAAGADQEYAALEANIYEINRYGNILLSIGAESLRRLGYEPGDIVLIRIGDSEMEMPIGTAYTDADSGEPLCCFRTSRDGLEVISLGINAGNLASVMGVAEIRTIAEAPGYEIVWADGLDASVSVSVSMAKKQGYADELRMHRIGFGRTNNREDYPQLDDEAYANFRAVNTTGMGTDTLFRSSSPINPALNRNEEADEALLNALVRTVVNMADSREEMETYADYALTNYARCDIIALGMGMDFQSEAFREGIAKGCRFMLSHDGPYLIHCIEGKDRTGFLCALLECLMGADADEVVADYMLTYMNFYGLEPGVEQYRTIVSTVFDPILSRAFGINSIYDENADLSGCAVEYLRGLGLNADEIAGLRQKLGQDYGGLSNDAPETGNDPALERLNEFAAMVREEKAQSFGFPGNQNVQLTEFYEWLIDSGLDTAIVNNAGDPFNNTDPSLNALDFEREVIEFFGPLYGFDSDNLWGIVTFSGTDGNNHGIYFGSKYLEKLTQKKPVVYVSDAAHYSNMRLADLQNLDLVLVPSDEHGCMIPEEFEKLLIKDRPALMIYAMGTTFKGGIDDQEALNAVLAKYPSIEVYRHVDAALFGGFLPYTEYRDAVNRNVHPFDSIAISGHKFFGMDEPAGLFLTTMEIKNNQNPYNVTYLNGNMPMINCSRSAIAPLKFWWIIQHVGIEGFTEQASGMLDRAAWLKAELDALGWEAWLEPMSNTVYFVRPPEEIAEKYMLAPDYDERLGGELSHIVVMQHVTKERLQEFLDDLADCIHENYAAAA